MITKSDKLQTMRHSVAHIMAAAVQQLWPDAKFGVGPTIANGFYYDIEIEKKRLSEDDFKSIEKEMKKIVSSKKPINKTMMKIDEAINWAESNNQPYKKELLIDLKDKGTTNLKELGSVKLSGTKEVTFYQTGSFMDLCKGPHLSNTAEAGVFKIMRVAGAYWRGNEKNPQMQRLYGVAFQTTKELEDYLLLLEEAKKRDHRKLGQELDLFVFSDLVGPGLPLFTPKGTILREELGKFSQELQSTYGYQRVTVPHITKVDLYKKSGHFDKYPEKFMVTSYESDETFMMKPMNCPQHAQIYASRPRSYKDLPIRYMENTMVYRDEKAGELHGLTRVRAATQDDGHVFCRFDQIEQEFESIMSMIKDMYSVFGMKFQARLSFRDDSDNYLGDKKDWDEAQKIIENVAKKLKLNYTIVIGEAAFYGPKIDIMVNDSLGREWQCATEQLDFVQPARFELEYTDKDGDQKRPVMIHKALLGSLERFLAVYIEHTGGRFPVWLAPEQIRLLTINQTSDIIKYSKQIIDNAKNLGLRISLDDSNQSVSKKIKMSEQQKIPYTVVIGEKELKTSKIIPRIRSDIQVQKPALINIDNFLNTVLNEAKSRVNHTTI